MNHLLLNYSSIRSLNICKHRDLNEFGNHFRMSSARMVHSAESLWTVLYLTTDQSSLFCSSLSILWLCNIIYQWLELGWLDIQSLWQSLNGGWGRIGRDGIVYLWVFDHLSMVDGRSECPNLKAEETKPLAAEGLVYLKEKRVHKKKSLK